MEIPCNFNQLRFKPKEENQKISNRILLLEYRTVHLYLNEGSQAKELSEFQDRKKNQNQLLFLVFSQHRHHRAKKTAEVSKK